MNTSSFDTVFDHPPTSAEVQHLLEHLSDQPEESWPALAEAAFEWAANHDHYDLAYLALKSGCLPLANRMKVCIQAGQTQAARAVAARENGWSDGLQDALISRQWDTATLFLNDMDTQRLRSPGCLSLFMQQDDPKPQALGLRLIERFIQQAPTDPSGHSPWFQELENTLTDLRGPQALTLGRALLDQLPLPVPVDTGREILSSHLIKQQAEVAALMVPLTTPTAMRHVLLGPAHQTTLDRAVRAQPPAIREAWLADRSLKNILPLTRVRVDQEDEALVRQTQGATLAPERSRRRRPT